MPMHTSTRAREVGEAELLDLLDWKRRVVELYATVRRSADIPDSWRRWREARAELLRTHPQSPLPLDGRETLHGVSYFEYDPRARVLAEVRPVEAETLAIGTSHPSSIDFTRFACARFELDGHSLSLELYWLEGYGGGLFLPFADTTSGDETYGGGRYLLDTVKGADLGTEDGRLVLDFNFAYNPSCAYDASWLCPLAPPRNRLPVAVRAGERLA
jgi:uncharacterized protein (DUF1684 family)